MAADGSIGLGFIAVEDGAPHVCFGVLARIPCLQTPFKFCNPFDPFNLLMRLRLTGFCFFCFDLVLGCLCLRAPFELYAYVHFGRDGAAWENNEVILASDTGSIVLGLGDGLVAVMGLNKEGMHKRVRL